MKKRFLLFTIVFIILLSSISVICYAEPKELEPVPEVTAQKVVMLNLETGAYVNELTKAADEIAYPASLTKLVTLLVASELITDYNQTVVADKSCYDDLVVGSSNINVKDGEIFKYDDLMYAVAISSANEASNVLAINLCGSIQAFVDKMNEKAAQLGATNTHFINTHGLHDEQHYTTANDMAKIAKAAFSNERVLAYVSASTHIIEPTNKTTEKRTLITTNSLMRQNSGIYYKYCKAGKTGTTTAAGYNLISLSQKGDCSFLLVAMNAPKATGTNPIFSESRSMYAWAFNNYSNSKILNDSEIITEVEVELSAKGDHLILIPEKNIYAVIPKNLDITSLEREIVTQEEVFAPITQGDVLGTVTLKKDGIVYGSANLIASDDIDRSTVLYYLHLIRQFFKNIWVRIICALLLVFIIIYVIVMISQNNNKRRKKLRRRVRF